MEKINSISVTTDNEFCDSTLCKKFCYAVKLEERYKQYMKIHLFLNMAKLQMPLEQDEIPKIYDRFFRFNATGAIVSSTQIENYLRIAEKNPDCNFAIFFKNLIVVKEVQEKYSHLKNVVFVFGLQKVNPDQKQIDLILNRNPWIHKVFSVYDKAGSKKVSVNCAKKCIECLMCYTPKNTTRDIKELKK